MKTNTTNHDVHINSLESFEFTAEMNAETFGLLIDKLYSDKISAVIRELGANAVDSHKCAGNDESFAIHLPNALEPWFSIRDYGIGLDGEEIRTLYTRLGASSKRDSNDFIGCMGIGSKAPFAYTDTFTITSYKAGVRYSYCAFIGDKGIPAIAIFEEDAPTSETNGLEVRLTVKPTDFVEFQTKAKKIYEFFEIRP